MENSGENRQQTRMYFIGEMRVRIWINARDDTVPHELLLSWWPIQFVFVHVFSYSKWKEVGHQELYIYIFIYGLSSKSLIYIYSSVSAQHMLPEARTLYRATFLFRENEIYFSKFPPLNFFPQFLFTFKFSKTLLWLRFFWNFEKC